MLTAADGYLRERGIDAPRLSAEWMLARVLSMSRLDVYLAHDRPLSEAEKAKLREMVARRGKGEPLAYILGDQDFCDVTLRVTPDVLIPRPETEQLVALLAKDVPQGARGIDLGTGSGAIAIALCHMRPDLTMVATDLSAAALTIARENASTAGVADRVEFREGSWWEPVGEGERFEFVTSNPPYVDPAQPELLAADVREFEPALALFTPEGEPGAAYSAIAAGLETHTNPGALILCETGVGAAEASRDAIATSGVVGSVALRDDDAGLPRFIEARVTGE